VGSDEGHVVSFLAENNRKYRMDLDVVLRKFDPMRFREFVKKYYDIFSPITREALGMADDDPVLEYTYNRLKGQHILGIESPAERQYWRQRKLDDWHGVRINV